MAVSGCAPLYRGMVVQFDGRELPPLAAGLAPPLSPAAAADYLADAAAMGGDADGCGADGGGSSVQPQREDSMGSGAAAADGGGDVIVPGGARLRDDVASASATSLPGGYAGGYGGVEAAVPCRVIGIAKLKCLCYLQRTFGVRNMLPLLIDKGPAAYMEGVGRFFKNWQVSV